MNKAYQALIKTLGRGEKGSRALTLSETHLLIRGFSDGIGTKVQLAAALMLMRVRGETIEEVAGAALGIKSTISEQWSDLDVSIDWPCYAGKRELLPWLLLAAKLLASQGERVLLHGDHKSLSHRKHIAAFVEALGITKVNNPIDAKMALDNAGICYVDADHFTPLVAQFRELHQELGLRSLFQTAIRCTNPANAAVSLRSYFHPGLDKMHLAVAKLMAKTCLAPRLTAGVCSDGDLELSTGSEAEQAFALNGRVGIFKGVQGETEINPRISTELTITSQHCSYMVQLPTRLEGLVGISTLSSELTLLPEQASLLLNQIWQSDVEASKGLRTSNNTLTLCAPTMEKLQKIAEASVISTLSAVYLLQGKSESVDEVENLAKIAWRAR